MPTERWMTLVELTLSQNRRQRLKEGPGGLRGLHI